MRVVIAWIVAVLALGAADAWAQTVWNVKVGGTQLRVLDETPDVAFSGCRCVAGRWRLAPRGETATHFSGTLDALSFNHERRHVPSLRVKIRKTRALMGVHRDYRERLMGVVRGEGALVLREVRGGEWEVAAWSDALVAELFAQRPKWIAVDPEPARPGAIVDPIADAKALAKLLNDYRASIGLPRVPISRHMTKVAQAHARDLAVNKPTSTTCDMHSWSDRGKWTPCCGDDSGKSAACMQRKAKEIAGYRGRSYEIAATAAGITPARALELWQKSPRHHAIVRNEGQWAQPWKAMGVAVEGDYAVAWFGNLP